MKRDKALLLISGLAGSGKSVVLNALADLGYTCVDNLPAVLLNRFVTLAERGSMRGNHFAIALDARDPTAPEEIVKLFGGEPPGIRVEALFLEASEASLIARFRETRRAHPLMVGSPDADSPPAPTSLAEAIQRDIGVVAPIRAVANRVIDTSDLSVPALKQLVRSAYAPEAFEPEILLNLMSFGFKHGSPQGVDTVFDVRCFKNPHYVAELRSRTGLEEAVRDFVFADPNVEGFLARVQDLLGFLQPLYATEGKRYFTVGIGCTGGRHRSVAIAEELGKRLTGAWKNIRIDHRDLARE